MELIHVSELTIELMNFIHLNIHAIQKIIKKFDKKFHKQFGNITSWFLKNRLTINLNSDLNYMLQLKVK